MALKFIDRKQEQIEDFNQQTMNYEQDGELWFLALCF